MDASLETTLSDVLDHGLGEAAVQSMTPEHDERVDHNVGLRATKAVAMDQSQAIRLNQHDLSTHSLAPSTPVNLHSVTEQSHPSSLHIGVLSTTGSPATPSPPPVNGSPDAGSVATPVRGKRGRKPKAATEKTSLAVDVRRREANRLAAERSRGRQHEKVVALELAVQALGEENIRLKEEIGKLEGRERASNDPNAQASIPVPDSADTAAAVVEATNAAAAAAAAASSSGATPTVTETQTQADTQSRNILVALLSQPGVPFDEALAAGFAAADDADTATWMHSVEGLFKDAEASGRLGELAAVAAGQGEGPPSAINGSHQQDPSILNDGISSGAETPSGSAPTAANSKPGLTLGASAVAAVINAEMEKALREELVQTRASIVRVEQELARVRGYAAYEDPVDPLPPSAIPSGWFDLLSEGDLQARKELVDSEVAQLKSEAAVLREVVSRMATAQAEESDKVKAAAEELRSLDMDGGEQERDKVSLVLNALRATISNLMVSPATGEVGGLVTTPFASPATARRRRGRPPKNGGVLSSVKPFSSPFPYSFRMTSPLPQHRSNDDGSPLSGRVSARTRLSQVTLQTENAAAGPSGTDKGSTDEPIDEASAVANSQEVAPPQHEAGATAANQSEAEEQDSVANSHLAEASGEIEIPPSNEQVNMDAPQPAVDEVHALVAQALPHPHAHAHNDYLMSHLTEVGEARPIPLDSSSFAAFLPQSPHQHAASLDAAAAAFAPVAPQASDPPGSVPVPVPGSVPNVHVHESSTQPTPAAAAAAVASEPPPNVLSRLKRGPPGSCDICGRTETTVWRKLTLGSEEHKVCNPCGLYHSKFGIIRPPELWGDGKSVKKRRTSARPSTGGFEGSPNGAKRGKRKSAGGTAHRFVPFQPQQAQPSEPAASQPLGDVPGDVLAQDQADHGLHHLDIDVHDAQAHEDVPQDVHGADGGGGGGENDGPLRGVGNGEEGDAGSMGGEGPAPHNLNDVGMFVDV